eukprot:g77741.t1
MKARAIKRRKLNNWSSSFMQYVMHRLTNELVECKKPIYSSNLHQQSLLNIIIAGHEKMPFVCDSALVTRLPAGSHETLKRGTGWIWHKHVWPRQAVVRPGQTCFKKCLCSAQLALRLAKLTPFIYLYPLSSQLAQRTQLVCQYPLSSQPAQLTQLIHSKVVQLKHSSSNCTTFSFSTSTTSNSSTCAHFFFQQAQLTQLVFLYSLFF